MARDDVSDVSGWSLSEDVKQVLYNADDGSLLEVGSLLDFLVSLL